MFKRFYSFFVLVGFLEYLTYQGIEAQTELISNIPFTLIIFGNVGTAIPLYILNEFQYICPKEPLPKRIRNAINLLVFAIQIILSLWIFIIGISLELQFSAVFFTAFFILRLLIIERWAKAILNR